MPEGQLPPHSEGADLPGQDIVKPTQTRVLTTSVQDVPSSAIAKNDAPLESATKDTSPVA
jgi:hypothetical protein